MANEKRLVYADALMDKVLNHPRPYRKDFYRMLKDAPTVDAVEVIRCESCKWYEPECENCDFWGGYRNPDHYCGEGERKNEAG